MDSISKKSWVEFYSINDFENFILDLKMNGNEIIAIIHKKNGIQSFGEGKVTNVGDKITEKSIQKIEDLYEFIEENMM